jgi:ElaB/YqjD/DUF883 family membrane-anchored ribosome-binding protein
MSEKTPYELRKDILDLAFDVVNSQYEQQKKYLELQHSMLMSMMDFGDEATEEIKKNTEKAMKDVSSSLKSLKVPSMEDMMNAAKTFQTFVNQKS